MQEEVTKHTKKIYNTMKNTEHTLGEKTKEIIIEIFIIVFAVTLSIGLHSWSEERHQHKEAQAFLIGLKEDLKNDISNLEETKKILNQTHQQISFVRNLTPKKLDSMKANHQQINSGTNFINTIANNGRYEGFKSSGKINTIEDENLRNKILSYYQQTIPHIALKESQYEKLTSTYIDLLLDGKEDEDINTTILKERTKIILAGIEKFTKSSQKSYANAINCAKGIVNSIDKKENK
jgi:hypothetical protein